MRCSACNMILSSAESTRKFKQSNTYVDLCDKCLSTISDEVETIDGFSGEEECMDDNQEDLFE